MTNIDKLIAECEAENAAFYEAIDGIALFNQEKVLAAFQKNRIAPMHFAATTGYGYDDAGRAALGAVFADAFGCGAAIVSPLLASGTHAISTALFGLLRPGDLLLSISGTPYDTLMPVIGGDGIGSLRDFGVKFDAIELLADGTFDTAKIIPALKKKPAVITIQRSRGYAWRRSVPLGAIADITALIKSVLPDTVVAVDNCYGEFVEKAEPTAVGADLIIGSLIKNPGGGIAPGGGYIAGKKNLIERIANRLTAPGVGVEIGSYAAGYRSYFQGFFVAPHVVAQAAKGSRLFASVFSRLGYETLPTAGDSQNDIICSVKFNTERELIDFCGAVQRSSPVDSFATPYPWDMPGYESRVIMAAGTFVQGASIELSADSPIRAPYIAYAQGGLTYEHIKIALKNTVKTVLCQT
ncbi:MAG: methionine gamma-lyase family protein [Clostridiales bacterium]|jgi:cystathionine beta-lyase family protein involved in aluminum resistance|nr:methionine gamma-lyase family protein [Clostridiales bacterium]